MLNESVASAVTTEGFGNSNLTFLKKVTITDEVNDAKKTLHYFYSTNPETGVTDYLRSEDESIELVPVTEEEFFFAKDVFIYQEYGERKLSWYLGENEGYHESK